MTETVAVIGAGMAGLWTALALAPSSAGARSFRELARELCSILEKGKG